MIDIQIYIDRLEELRHKINCQIDGYIWINYDVLPKWSAKKIIEFFNETGYFFYQSPENSFTE